MQIRQSIGQDNGVTVRYAKNIQTITSEENWDNVVTKLLPVGKDGLLLDTRFVESERQYDRPYTKTVSFSQNLERLDGESDADYIQRLKDDLEFQAEEYVGQYSLPEVNYSVKTNLEKITGIGDTVEVIDERLGINLLTNVISYDYDAILGQYTNIELGNFKDTIEGLFGKITSSVEQTVNRELEASMTILNSELKAATDTIMAHFENSYVIYDGNQILIVDTLPKDYATYCIRINSGGIGFSSTGINGTFNSAWTIDGTLDMQNINVINLTADLIHGNTLTLGGAFYPTPGEIRLYDGDGNLIGIIGQNGVKMLGGTGTAESNRPYVLMNNTVGFAGYDASDNEIYWARGDEFHMKKTMAEEELTICETMRFIKIDLTTNKGIGLVAAE